MREEMRRMRPIYKKTNLASQVNGGIGRQGQKADAWPVLVAFFVARVGPLTGAGPGFHHTKKRVPRPCRVFCDRAGRPPSLQKPW
jgi:hypothetical protein